MEKAEAGDPASKMHRFHVLLAVNSRDGIFNQKAAQSAGQCISLAWLALCLEMRDPSDVPQSQDEGTTIQTMVRHTLSSLAARVNMAEQPQGHLRDTLNPVEHLEITLTVAYNSRTWVDAIEEIEADQGLSFVHISAATGFSDDNGQIVKAGGDNVVLPRQLMRRLADRNPRSRLLVELCGPVVGPYWTAQQEPHRASSAPPSSAAAEVHSPVAYLRGVAMQPLVRDGACKAVVVTSSTPQALGTCEALHQSSIGNGFHKGMQELRDSFFHMSPAQASSFLDLIIFGKFTDYQPPEDPDRPGGDDAADKLTSGLEDLKLKANDEDVASHLINLAHVLCKQGNTAEAIERFEQALALSKQPRLRATILFGLGKAYKRVGSYDDAIKCLKHCLQCHEEAQSPVFHMVNTRITLAEMFSAANRDEDALRELEAILHLFPQADTVQLADVHHRLGCIHVYTTRRFRMAKRHLEQAQTLASKAAKAKANLRVQQQAERIKTNATNVLGRALLELGDITRAIVTFNKAMNLKADRFGRISPEVVRVRINMAYAYLEFDRIAEARAMFQECLADQLTACRTSLGDRIDTLNQIGRTYVLQGSQDDALRYLSRAQRLFSEAVERVGVPASAVSTLHYRAALCIDIDRNDEAIELLEQAARLSDSVDNDEGRNCRAVTHRIRGDLAMSQNNVGLAMQEYQQCLDIQRDIGPKYSDELAESRYLVAQRLYRHGGQQEAALQYAEEAIPIVRQLHGRNHPAMARVQELRNEIAGH